MSTTTIGLVIIGLAAILLTGTSILFNKSINYSTRRMPAVERLKSARIAALEQGAKSGIVLGNHLWAIPYHGLGLHPLTILPNLTGGETMMKGSQEIYGGDGSLVVFARQILSGKYLQGYSEGLANPDEHVFLPGPTPLTFTAGILPVLSMKQTRSLFLSGSFGPESLLWSEAGLSNGAAVFAAAGSMTSQAVLYGAVRDILLGEEVYMLPGLLSPSSSNKGGWLTEDVLRIALILMLLLGAVLKLAGVL